MSERSARRNGRPPLDLDDPSVAVSFRLPARQYDALCQRASRDQISVAETIRRTIAARDRDDDDR